MSERLRTRTWVVWRKLFTTTLELELPAYATVTATQDPSLVFDEHHSSGQHQSLNPLSKARDQTASSWILVRFITAEP